MTASRNDKDKTLVGVMHLAKGLEFVPSPTSPDENVRPLAAHVTDVGALELDEGIATERQFLTLPRRGLLVSGISLGLEFIERIKIAAARPAGESEVVFCTRR